MKKNKPCSVGWVRRLIARLFPTSAGIYYINGPELLPAPLSSEEENRCISRLSYDENAKNTLIEHNLRLVVYIAKRFENTGTGIEDLISIGAGSSRRSIPFVPTKTSSLQPMPPGASKTKY